jgi:hypothetical protein
MIFLCLCHFVVMKLDIVVTEVEKIISLFIFIIIKYGKPTHIFNNLEWMLDVPHETIHRQKWNIHTNENFFNNIWKFPQFFSLILLLYQSFVTNYRKSSTTAVAVLFSIIEIFRRKGTLSIRYFLSSCCTYT